MSASSKLKVVLCWHMHQPQYRDLLSGQYSLPWTYLHAIKDYADMAAHLEAVPAARAVVNFAPLLLEQLDDYVRQIDAYLAGGTALRDPLLTALVQLPPVGAAEARRRLILECLRVNEERVIQRFPAFARLAALAREALDQPAIFEYLGDAFFSDLVTSYHLAWLGETVRRERPRVRALQDQAARYSANDRHELLALIGELLRGIVPRYQRLAKHGQVELSVTPYAHPIMPLLLDFQSTYDAMPDAKLPLRHSYPGGAERVRWHVREGITTFERHFGFKPSGCWPSEGSISDATLKILDEAGFAWAASGETVLTNSLLKSGHAAHAMKAAWLYRPYQVDGGHSACFFRDDSLSDLIGFTYAKWHADDAVANLIQHLQNIADNCREHPDRIVSIILDGENAWEYYPENGYYFLSALYQRLAAHPRISLTTYSDYLKEFSAHPVKTIAAGSWVYGTFSTWIGDAEKNRAWDMLGEAKQVFDQVASQLGAEQRAAATRQLAVCEGSDWFWWFGDYNPESAVSDFERLYRLHLSNLYRLLQLEPPEYLSRPFTQGAGTPVHGGTMRPGQAP